MSCRPILKSLSVDYLAGVWDIIYWALVKFSEKYNHFVCCPYLTIGAGLVIGTFLYAPIMFIFAGMATLVHVNLQHYDETLERTGVYLSWASLLCCGKFPPSNVIFLSIRKRDNVRATVSKELEGVVEVTPESKALTTADGLGKLVVSFSFLEVPRHLNCLIDLSSQH
ncbi:hypothetical protein TSMEX_008168 [Taenia solium]|eukprot:TsM_001020200 transcript=TsM_001020200 gene=TsM_001020200